MTGVTWETKPDGKPGWQMYFINAGHDVYVSDAVERGRASWSRFPEVYSGEPVFRTKKEAWEAFRIGPDGSYATEPAQRKSHAGQLFPIAAFDAFAMQSVPRWVSNDAKTQAAYNALVAKVCPCVIVVHSQGGNFGFNAAMTAPDKVKGLIAMEPSGAPPETANRHGEGCAAARRVGASRHRADVDEAEPSLRSSITRRSPASAGRWTWYRCPRKAQGQRSHAHDRPIRPCARLAEVVADRGRHA